MTTQIDFETAARDYYLTCFGPSSDVFSDDYRTEEGVLAVDHLTHSFRHNDEWEILLTTGVPAARVFVEVDEWGDPVRATFEYQDWLQPWTAPDNQDPELLLAWVSSLFYFGCDYCDQERRR